ncbi:DUF3575 domain-containing protein [Aurantibacter crassamenti]|uniref:DUF3575 domain-containing protein n=1 Tax=Aurantibacter crassamenti TaxID=1837375 RepID=UPI00193A3BE6|nr:DUF3575 domain-containing protein [Aurantibacter crassamenti]MBM1104865.1 DUF3575 domain-containing protein [Aurantibacter crassamenti]
MTRFLIVFLCFTLYYGTCFSQEDGNELNFNNQVSSNISYLVMGSLNLSYERSLSKYFTIGVSGVNYGNNHKELRLSTWGFDYATIYEVNPFGRWYIRNTQRNSPFLEIFGSFNRNEKENVIVRFDNEEGYGVYEYGVEGNESFGAGVGFGYKLLLAKKRLVLEAQLGVRSNFKFDYFILDAELVRTGIRLGYRF